MRIRYVLTLLGVVLLAIIAGAFFYGQKIQRGSNAQDLAFQALISSLFAGNTHENLTIHDPRNIVAQCGKSAQVITFYASSFAHRFDYRILCENKSEAYVQVQASDDGRHSFFVSYPPVNAKASR